MLRILLSALLFSWSLMSLAWDFTGHQIIAEIAEERLTLNARASVHELVLAAQNLDPQIHYFSQLAIWPDLLSIQGVNTFDSWHYIDIPFSADGTPLPTHDDKGAHVVWAIEQSLLVLQNPHAPVALRAEFLAYLVHTVADIHQPLHAISRYAQITPQGDRGGNDYLLKTDFADNLHAYWDQSAGAFDALKGFKRGRHKQIVKIAQALTTQYPPDYFHQQLMDLNPHHWALDSHQLAMTVAYQTPYDAAPSTAYQQQVQTIAKQRLTLAGYRLAALLNQIFKPAS